MRSTGIILLVLFGLMLSVVNCQNLLQITVNTISLFNGDNVTLTSANLASLENGAPSPARVIYRVVAITNGQFRLLNTATGTYTPVTQFTQGDLSAGLVNFQHANNQQIPSYTLVAQDTTLGLLSQESTVAVTFSAFNRGTVGAPRPIFEADIDPDTLIVTLRITVFKRVFDTPEVNFNLGLSRKEQCTQSDFIRDGFQLLRSTNWFNTYIYQATLNQFLANPNVQQITNGGVIDIVANMWATYMITQVTTWPGTGQQELNCYQVVYSQRYVLSIALAVTRVNFNQTSPESTLKPTKIFVNDLGRLEIRFIVMTTVQQNATSWSVTGPFTFTVTDAIFGGVVNSTTIYYIAMQSNVINGVVNFFGDYNLIFTTTANGVFQIPYSLQYTTVGGPITQQLIFNTTALTYADAAFTIPRSQFAPTDTINVRVEAPEAADLNFREIAPYTVAMCCYLPFESIPSVVDCRNAVRADFSTLIFLNGTAVRAGGLNTDVIPTTSTQNYGFQFGIPLAIRDNIDRTCFLTIESSYQPSNTARKRSIVATTQVGSLTQKAFSVAAGTKGSGDNKNNNGTRSAANTNFSKVQAFLMIGLVILAFVF
ncbi:hypothetical protein ABK040_001089 [Willaertia magna]